MTDPSPHTEAAAPRWVKTLGIIAAVLILMGVGHFLTGGGPGFHTLPSGQQRGAQP